ncbi:MAG: hypothetical protein OES57_01965 [Acidimicrobiia bacterium]|nr:hypothetical protein [Acidimicrobiia bacterium]
MHVTGIIFACVDTDVDNLEAWNRWYDLEHLPPNIALDGIMSGRRYAADPALHEARLPAEPMAGFAGGQGTNVTIYTLCGDPPAVIADMTSTRDVLEAAGRMDGAGNRVVRAGDAMHYVWGLAPAAYRADHHDIPLTAHDGLRVVLRRGDDDAVRDTVAPQAIEVDGVHAVCSFTSVFMAGMSCELYLLEGDTAAVTSVLRDAAPHPDGVEVLLDAPFASITPFDYRYVERIRGSWMPQRIDQP